MTKSWLIYEGKAKRLFEIETHPELIYQEFKNSLTAFNGVKKGEISGKGEINRNITVLIFKYLESKGHKTHFMAADGTIGLITKRVKIIPLEVVVRNVLAGSLAKKFNLSEGGELSQPIVDFHYKDDALNDPFLSEDQATIVLKLATPSEIQELKTKALQINSDLISLFESIGLRLVDFKLEFGKTQSGQIVLADEITPDSCRLWDIRTGEKRDKDRFRRDLGSVLENYQLVFEQLQKKLEDL